MTDSEIVEQIKFDLGWPVIEVYTPDKSIESFIKKGLEEFRAQVYQEVSFVVPNRSHQKLDHKKIRFVFDVTPYQFTSNNASDINVYYRDEFSLSDAIRYFNVFSGNSIIVPVVASILYNQINYNFNMSFDWEYDDTTGELYTTHIPDGTQFLVVKAKIIYERESLAPEHDKWLLSYAEAQTKITEGRIRGKYKEGSVGATSDSDQLIQEGQAELQTAIDNLQSFIPLDLGRRA